MSIRISVALPSYNGAAFIEEQLESISKQERLPDELIVCDDGSSDHTVELIRRFAARAPFSVRIEENPVRLGVTKNFEKVISHCGGDLIFLSDQDDVWFPAKIRTMQSLLEANAAVQIAVNDAVLVEHDLSLRAPSLLSNTTRAKGLEEEFYPGCCTVVRKTFRDLCLPFPVRSDGSLPFGYDGWLNFVGSLLSVKQVVRSPLQYYRRHGGNFSNSLAFGSRVSSLVRLRSERDLLRKYRRDGCGHMESLVERLTLIELVLDRLEQLRRRGEAEVIVSKIGLVQRRKADLERRIAICRFPKGKRLAAATSFLCAGGYRSSRGVKSFIVDVLK